ncbi:hypothetical protein BJX70DRAFT_88852 [Aspergillus crustosus]
MNGTSNEDSFKLAMAIYTPSMSGRKLVWYHDFGISFEGLGNHELSWSLLVRKATTKCCLRLGAYDNQDKWPSNFYVRWLAEDDLPRPERCAKRSTGRGDRGRLLIVDLPRSPGLRAWSKDQHTGKCGRCAQRVHGLLVDPGAPADLRCGQNTVTNRHLSCSPISLIIETAGVASRLIRCHWHVRPVEGCLCSLVRRLLDIRNLSSTDW